MVSLRPHIMTWVPVSPSTVNGKGYPVAGVPGDPISVPCRFISGGGVSGIKELKNEDNTVVKQIGRISIDIGSVVPELYQEVTVTEGSITHFKGRIMDRYLGGHLTRWRLEV